MAIFTFDASHSLGRVRAVDTRRVDVQVNSDEDLRKARVGQLVAIALPGAIEEWLIGVIERVVKTPIAEDPSGLGLESDEEVGIAFNREGVLNTVQGLISWDDRLDAGQQDAILSLSGTGARNRWGMSYPAGCATPKLHGIALGRREN